MNTLLLSSCGTSSLTNNTSQELRNLLFRQANAQESDLSPEELAVIQDHIQTRKAALLNASHKEAKRISAELNGILSYYDTTPHNPQNPDQHILLASDTFQGRAVTSYLCEWLRVQGFQASYHVIQDLNTGELDTFRSAISELILWAEENIAPCREQGMRVVFNLTGGFKAIQGVLQTLGSFYADETVYIFQRSEQLLRIPRLPLKLDCEETLREHLFLFRRFNQGQTLRTKDCAGIPETLLMTIDKEATLSEWGTLVWEQSKKRLFSESILEPLSEKLRLSSSFLKTSNALPTDRIYNLNTQLDAFSVFLDSNRANPAPASLGFKKLKSDPSRYEIYAWSDRDAKRMFGHFEENGVFVVDILGNHL